MLKLASTADAIDPLHKQVLDALPDGLVLLDHDWRMVYANPAARRLSRLEPHHLNSKSLWEMFPESLDGPLGPLYRDAMQSRTPRRIDGLFRPALGVWFNIHALPIDTGLALYYHDVTPQHMAEETNRELRERIHLALDAANGIGVWDWNVPADLVFGDTRFADVYGIDRALAAGGVPIEMCTRNIHPEDAPGTSAAIDESLRSGAPFSHEYRLVQTDGTVRWVLAHGRCTHDDAGRPLRFAGVTIDITERKRIESALLQSEKLAAVGRMASSIAHEINNPLESVTNLLFIARQHDLPQEVHAFLELADQELRRVAIIANQTLRFNKQSIHPHDISCLDLFTSVLSLYEGRLRNSGIHVEKRKRAERTISCFEGDIRQVLSNIVSNAIDAMSFGRADPGGRLVVRSREATDWRSGQRGLTLTIADTGSGVPPEILQRIFEPFFTTKGMNGTGLGLWISAEIVARHQGRLLVRSSQKPEHHGTVFALFLPFVMSTP